MHRWWSPVARIAASRTPRGRLWGKRSLISSLMFKGHLTLSFVAHHAVGATKVTMVVSALERLVARFESLIGVAAMRWLMHVRWWGTRHRMAVSVVHAAGRSNHLVILVERERSHQRTATTTSSDTCGTKAVLSVNFPRWYLSHRWRLTHLWAVYIHRSDGTTRRRTRALVRNVGITLWAWRHAMRHWRS